ncbi:hypothetical protein Daus18300_014562 [Diaporthe australafricana]|uniref:Uncharacterized protein n=1 Tax=Diaporthe australafricana TaxID=127596 RepID=A0ABR3VUN7_9PEZI
MSEVQGPPLRVARASVTPRSPMSHRMESWGLDIVDQQGSSPLFNGRIPAEIRTLIFQFTLAESTVPALDRPVQHAFFSRDDHEELDDEPEPDLETGPAVQADEESAQPSSVEDGHAPAPAVQMPPTSFLSPYKHHSSGWDWGSKIFYSARGPGWCPQSPMTYFSGFDPEAARHIRNLQFFLQMYFLEGSLMDMVTGVHRVFGRRMRLPFTAGNPQPLQPLVPPAPFNPHPPGIPPVPVPVHLHPPGNLHPPFSVFLRNPGNPQPPRPSVSDPSEFGPMRAWRVTEHVTSLRIYLRRTDWWNWETNAPLVISPLSSPSSRPTLQQMHDSMRVSFEADQQLEPQLRSSLPSTVQQWRCWGLLFLRMTNLQTLSIDFETSEDKKSEMETIVDWAHQHWRFPVLRRLSGDARDPFTIEQLRSKGHECPVDLAPWSQDLDVLTAADQPVQKTSWRGLPHHFADQCPGCSMNWSVSNVTCDCADCKKKHKLTSLGKGPQMLVWSVNWTRKKLPRGAEEGTSAAEGSQEPRNQPQPSTVPDRQQDNARPSNVGTESHVLSMLPEDAQHRSRRRRELYELMNREVVF